MVTLRMHLDVDESNRDRFIDAVRGLMGPIRVESGNLTCLLCEDVIDSSALYLIQEWQDESGFRRHIHGPAFRTLLVSIDMLGRSPEISVTRQQKRDNLGSIGDLYEEA